MKQIYLDQNKWIDLSRADHGRPGGEAYGDALRVLEEGRRLNEVSLPLSAVHYMEIATRTDYDSRARLAETMLRLSDLRTIASIHELIPAEIDLALREMFGRPLTPRPLRLFGRGLQHAFGQPGPLIELSDELLEGAEDPVGMQAEANELAERYALIGPTPEQSKEMDDYEPYAHLPTGENYAKAKQELRTLRKDAGWHKGERAERVATAQALSDHLGLINDQAIEAGVSPSAIFDGGAEQATQFVESVPTMHASSELERIRANASVKEWERQDLNDISALSAAAVHCDIVVTERFWVDAAKRADLEGRHGTVFLSRLDDLPKELI